MSFRQSDSFKQNCFFWTVFGLWPGKNPEKYYRFFSFAYLVISLVVYNALLTINLYYTPKKVELLIREVIFFFTEIAVSTKACMILLKRKKLIAIFELLDCNEFKGSDDTGKTIVETFSSHYKKYLNAYTAISSFSYISLFAIPCIGYVFSSKPMEFPVCAYYFLSDETKHNYFTYIYLYQYSFMCGHMLYNVNIDSLIAGFMVFAIAQIKLLCHDIRNLKMDKADAGRKEELDHKQSQKLHKCINHYALIIKYCHDFQGIISATLFVQYGIGSAIICVTMCGLLLPSNMEAFMFMVGYFFAMNLQIFVPAWLGTQLRYESQELMMAAYKSEWVPRSEGYKRSLRLLVERAKNPLEITGLKIFPLSLATYISIMKTAYSCFTLVRFFIDGQKH